MYSTKYLYDCKPSDFSDLKYKEALEYKINAAQKLIDTLLTPHYTLRDDIRLSAVQVAKKFNEKLKEELEIDDTTEYPISTEFDSNMMRV